MNEHEYHKKLDEIISKFPNGIERYKTSATFNRVCQMLARGATEFEVIDQLVTITDDTQNAFSNYITRDTRPMLFNR
jgi:hypothetical protein